MIDRSRSEAITADNGPPETQIIRRNCLVLSCRPACVSKQQ